MREPQEPAWLHRTRGSVESQWESFSKYSSLVTRSNRQRQVGLRSLDHPHGTRGRARPRGHPGPEHSQDFGAAGVSGLLCLKHTMFLAGAAHGQVRSTKTVFRSRGPTSCSWCSPGPPSGPRPDGWLRPSPTVSPEPKEELSGHIPGSSLQECPIQSHRAPLPSPLYRPEAQRR